MNKAFIFGILLSLIALLVPSVNAYYMLGHQTYWNDTGDNGYTSPTTYNWTANTIQYNDSNPLAPFNRNIKMLGGGTTTYDLSNYVPSDVEQYNISYYVMYNSTPGVVLLQVLSAASDGLYFGTHTAFCTGGTKIVFSDGVSWMCTNLTVVPNTWMNFTVSINLLTNQYRVYYHNATGETYPLNNNWDTPVNTMARKIMFNTVNHNWVSHLHVWNGTATPPSLLPESLLYLRNIVNNNLISGFCINATGTNTSVHSCNTTGNVIVFNMTGIYNFSFFNVTGGNATPTYYNDTILNYNVNSTGGSIIGNTFQALAQISAYQLYTNNTITTFNVTTGIKVNTSNNNITTIPVNIGSNTINVSSTRNISQNYVLIVPGPFITQEFNATGIYDNKFFIGAKQGSTILTTINGTAFNNSLGLVVNRTSNGLLEFNLLRGYYYTFDVVPENYTRGNITIPANASLNYYNFSVFSENTFSLRFYNETTGGLLNNTVITLQVISDTYANNYTVTNGTYEISFLTPAEYTLRYYANPLVPRDYYVTLTPQSIENISLYIIDEDISTNYLPVVQDQSLKAVTGATVKLLRYYVSCNCYTIVEMAKTDTVGQAVIRVVPNTINYKLYIEKQGTTLITAPTKFTSSTNVYTMNFIQSVIVSGTTITNVSTSLTYNNATDTYIYVWDDDNNLISSACMSVTKYKNGVSSVVQSSCSSGTTGSIIYTVTDKNNTRYVAATHLNTNTQYSDYSDQVLTVDFARAFESWGLVGVFISLLIFLFFIFATINSGSEGIVLTGTISILLMSVVGFLTYRWEAIVGILIMAVIIMYKTRT